MKRILVVLVLGGLLAGPTTVLAQETPTITITDVIICNPDCPLSGNTHMVILSFELTPGWHLSDCTGLTADVTLSDGGTDTFIGGVLSEADNTARTGDHDGSIPPEVTIVSVQSAGFVCDLVYPYEVPKTFYTERIKLGTQWSSRGVVAYYSPKGWCDWGATTLGGLRTRCRLARAKVIYKFRLPEDATFRSVRHFATDGQSPCWNRRWKLSHRGRLYKVAFSHGSAIGRSECIIGYVSFKYSWVGTETLYETAPGVIASWTAP